MIIGCCQGCGNKRWLHLSVICFGDRELLNLKANNIRNLHVCIQLLNLNTHNLHSSINLIKTYQREEKFQPHSRNVQCYSQSLASTEYLAKNYWRHFALEASNRHLLFAYNFATRGRCQEKSRIRNKEATIVRLAFGNYERILMWRDNILSRRY